MPIRLSSEMFSNGSEWNPDLPFAVFSRSGIKLSGSASIIGHGGTNAINANAVDLSWATSIDSNLAIGPGGNPDTVVNQSNFINGNVGLSIGNLPAPLDYPLPKFPEFPTGTNARKLNRISPTALPPWTIQVIATHTYRS
ncbi:MAG: hypothetical protein U5K69_21140 [Balneolaceae bacterium]|nr:hypothetical protein [Balneolaceae bacterium]